MSIENAVKDVITAKLEEGIIEKLVAENLEKGINKALESLLGNYGDVTEVIKKKIKEVMVERLEGFDYSKYIVKLDAVLIEILKNTSLDHKKILKNFKKLMTKEEFSNPVKTSDIFEQFKNHVATNIDTGELEVDIEDVPLYEYVSVTMGVEYEKKRTWSSLEYAKIVFECEKDEALNCEIRLSRFKEYPWRLHSETDTSIKSLRRLEDFQIYLLQLGQAGDIIVIDSDYLEDDVRPEAEPEASFS